MYKKKTCQGAKWIFLLALLCLGLTAGAQTHKKVTIQLNNASLKEVFVAIKKQSNVGFMYSEKAIATLPRKNYQFKDESISKILNYALAGSEFTFEIENSRNIIIQRKNGNNVTGNVTDTNGEPLVGVSVYPVGTKQVKGAVTDLDGNFSFPSNGLKTVRLKFTFIGAKPQETTWSGKPLKITLEDDAHTIDEVVVTGYQNLDRRRSTVSATSVKMEDVLMPSMTTIDQALEGRIPDLVFTQNSGEVGATARLRVRGTSTLMGNREPLWVLDGFPLSDPVDVSTDQLNDPDYINYIGNAIQGINPQDIERIDVLKDAAATALYGTRASNGVIVITTKKGKPGAPSIRYSNQTKLTMRPRYTDKYINLMNSQERVQFGKDLCEQHYEFSKTMPLVGYEGAYYRYQTGQTSYNEFLEEVKGYETTNTDWFKLLTQDAITHSHTLSISGGSEKTRYYTSVGYTRENGTVKTQYVDRYTANMNFTTDLSKSLQARIQFNGNVQKKNHLPSDVKPLDYAYNTTRALPAYNEDGSLYFYQNRGYSNSVGGKSTNLYNYNIINEMNNTSNEYSGNTLSTSGDLSYRFGNILTLTASAYYSRSSTLQSTWYGEQTNYVAMLKNGEVDDGPVAGEAGYCELPYGGVYNTSNTYSENFTGRFQVNYNQSLGRDKKHGLSLIAGYEVNTARSRSNSVNTRGYYKDRGMKYAELSASDLDDFPLYKKWLAGNVMSLGYGKTNKLSGYLTGSYDYDEYFTLGGSFRFDASNEFGRRSNKKFLPVWSVSGRWNVLKTITLEPTFVDRWNIRASYGKTGNIPNQTPYLQLKQGTIDSFYGEYTSTVSSLPNPNLRWEQTATTNVGMDINLFGGRLGLETDLWWKHTQDAIISTSVSSVNGVTSFSMNYGGLDNHGGSISIIGTPVQTKDWRLYLSFMTSWSSNNVTTGPDITYNLSDYLRGTAIINGAAVGTFYSYKYLGLNPNNGLPMFDDYEDRQNLLEGKTLSEVVPMVMIQSGNREPKVTGSFSTMLTWKQLTMSMNFNYRFGSKIRMFNIYSPITSGVSADKNVRKEFLDRWQRPGDEQYTDIPVLLSPADILYKENTNHWSKQQYSGKIVTFAESIWDMYDNSDLRVVSGNYVKLSNWMFRYNFPQKLLRGTFLKSVNVNFTMSNVFTIASKKLNGQDPTQASQTGVNLSARPAYTFGVDVSF